MRIYLGDMGGPGGGEIMKKTVIINPWNKPLHQNEFKIGQVGKSKKGFIPNKFKELGYKAFAWDKRE